MVTTGHHNGRMGILKDSREVDLEGWVLHGSSFIHRIGFHI